MHRPSDQDKSSTSAPDAADNVVRINRIEAPSKIRIVPLGRETITITPAAQPTELPAHEDDALSKYQKIARPAPANRRVSRLAKLGLMAAGLGGVLAFLLYPSAPDVDRSKSAAAEDKPTKRPIVRSPEFIFEPTDVVPTRATTTPETVPVTDPKPTIVEAPQPVAPPVIHPDPANEPPVVATPAPNTAPVDTAPEEPEAAVVSPVPVPENTGLEMDIDVADAPDPVATPASPKPAEDFVALPLEEPAESEPVVTPTADTAAVQAPEDTEIETVQSTALNAPPDTTDWESGLVTDIVSGTLAALRAPDPEFAAIATIVRDAQSKGAGTAEITDLLNAARKNGEIDIPAAYLTDGGTIDLPAILSAMNEAG